MSTSTVEVIDGYIFTIKLSLIMYSLMYIYGVIGLELQVGLRLLKITLLVIYIYVCVNETHDLFES